MKDKPKYTPDPQGLYAKYHVFRRVLPTADNPTGVGDTVEGPLFVLRPYDPHARHALLAYAASVVLTNEQLARQLVDMVAEHSADAPMPSRAEDPPEMPGLMASRYLKSVGDERFKFDGTRNLWMMLDGKLGFTPDELHLLALFASFADWWADYCGESLADPELEPGWHDVLAPWVRYDNEAGLRGDAWRRWRDAGFYGPTVAGTVEFGKCHKCGELHPGTSINLECTICDGGFIRGRDGA